MYSFCYVSFSRIRTPPLCMKFLSDKHMIGESMPGGAMPAWIKITINLYLLSYYCVVCALDCDYVCSMSQNHARVNQWQIKVAKI